MKKLFLRVLITISISLLLAPLSVEIPYHSLSPAFAQDLLNSSSSEIEATNILIAESGNRRVIEINKNTGSIIWQVTGYSAACAYRLKNGNTLICDRHRVVEVDLARNVVWSVTIPGDDLLHDATRLPNGNTLISVVDYPNPASKGRVIELDTDGNEVWSEGDLHWPHQAVRLPPRENPRDDSPDGSTLMAYGSSRIHEKSMAGEIIWLSYLSKPAASLQRLPNLDTLVGLYGGIEERDYNGTKVWSVTEGWGCLLYTSPSPRDRS